MNKISIFIVALTGCFANALILPIFEFQDPPASPISGSDYIRSREFAEPIRDGNTVVATDFVTLNYEVSWELKPTGEFSDPKTWQCVTTSNRCKGGKHANHEACDTSCCAMDTKEKKATLRGKYKPDYKAMREAERDAAKGAIASGGTNDPRDWSSTYVNALTQAKNLAKELVTIPVPAFKKPCTTQFVYFGLRKYEFIINGSFTRYVRRVSGGKEIDNRTEPGATHSKVVAEVWLPETKPLHQKEEVVCSCKIKAEDPPHTPPPTENLFREFWYPYPTWEIGDDCTTEQPKECTYEMTGNGLTSLKCELMNNSDEECSLTIPAGTICTPNNDGYQVMATKQPATITCQPNQHSIVTIPATCTQIDKKEPTDNISFKFSLSFNPTLSSVLRNSNGSPIPYGLNWGTDPLQPFRPDPERAAITQTKTWVLQDAAPFDKVNKILFPGVTEGQYLESLYGLKDYIDPFGKWKPCFEPKLSLGWTASPEATGYLVEMVDDLNPNSFNKWISSVVDRESEDWKTIDEYIQGIRRGNSSNLQTEHVADLTSSMFESTNPKTRKAGIDFFNNFDPSLQQTIAEAGGLDGIENCLRSKDNKEVLDSFKIVMNIESSTNDRVHMSYNYFKDIFRVNGATPEIRKLAGGN